MQERGTMRCRRTAKTRCCTRGICRGRETPNSRDCWQRSRRRWQATRWMARKQIAVRTIWRHNGTRPQKEAGPQNAAAKPRHNGGEAAVAAAKRPLGREGSRVSEWGVPEARRWWVRAGRGRQIASPRSVAPGSEKQDAAMARDSSKQSPSKARGRRQRPEGGAHQALTSGCTQNITRRSRVGWARLGGHVRKPGWGSIHSRC